MNYARQNRSQELNNVPKATRTMNPNTTCHNEIGADPPLQQAWTAQDNRRHS